MQTAALAMAVAVLKAFSSDFEGGNLDHALSGWAGPNEIRYIGERWVIAARSALWSPWQPASLLPFF